MTISIISTKFWMLGAFQPCVLLRYRIVYTLLSILREGKPKPKPTATPSRFKIWNFLYLFIKETGTIAREGP